MSPRVGGPRLGLVVHCPCGQRAGVDLSEGSWTCEGCGMEWDLGDVPPGEYEAVARSVRRAKAASLAGLVLAVAVFAPLALLSRAFIGTGLVVVAVWYYWYGPYHRRRVSRLYASLPRWQVRAAPCLRALPGPTIESPRGPEAGNQP